MEHLLSRKRNEVFHLALLSRFMVLVLQAVANLAPDHSADAFDPNVEPSTTFVDTLLRNLLDGFNKWDSKHILHVAEHGYDSEFSFAFFPLLPLIVHAIASALVWLCPFLTFHACCLASAVSLNFIAFTGSALALFDLTLTLFDDVAFSVLSSVAFCFNPASIFFSACYTESLYAFCVFKALKHLFHRKRLADEAAADFRDHLQATVWFALASLARSNGMVNCGFIIYSYAWYFVANLTGKRDFYTFVSYSSHCVLLCGCIVLPIILFNFYGFMKFCQNCSSDQDSCTGPVWCSNALPSIYNHIQKENWGLGLFAYYRLRKIPNFLLAAPIFILSLHSSKLYLLVRKTENMYLGLPFNTKNKTMENHELMFLTRNIFCFIAHLCFLIGFAALFMHIEVTTRMVLSSSPVLYWIAASYVHRDIIPSKSPLLTLSTWGRLSLPSKLIVAFFLSYVILGIILHTNFLPWT